MIIYFLFFFYFFGSQLQASDIQFLFKGENALAARLNFIRQETQQINLLSFEFDDSPATLKIFAELLAAKERGVDVNLVLDRSALTPLYDKMRDYLQFMASKGINVRIHTGLKGHHMKIMTGSSQRSYMIGDRNLKGAYMGHGETRYISSELISTNDSSFDRVEQFTQNYLRRRELKAVKPKFFPLAAAKIMEASEAPLPPLPRRPIQFEFEGQIETVLEDLDSLDKTLLKNTEMKKRIYDLLESATKELTIVNPYLLLDKEIIEILKRKTAAGVDVTILTDSFKTSTNLITAVDFSLVKDELIGAGVNVWLLDPKTNWMVHEKLILVDGQKSYIGSFNLDPLSKNLNLESGVILHDRKATSILNAKVRKLKVAEAFYLAKFNIVQFRVICGLAAVLNAVSPVFQ